MTTAAIDSPDINDIETRLRTVEAELQELKSQIGKAGWLDGFIGCMEGFPEFDEVIAEGKKFRESHPYADEVSDAW
ncbi:MAG: hypothetical protein IT428_10210 [Planctomycetaceae bacterium]|nr:hypothetical protein [Planctomycetaceae bacterium]